MKKLTITIKTDPKIITLDQERILEELGFTNQSGYSMTWSYKAMDDQDLVSTVESLEENKIVRNLRKEYKL